MAVGVIGGGGAGPVTQGRRRSPAQGIIGEHRQQARSGRGAVLLNLRQAVQTIVKVDGVVAVRPDVLIGL